MKMKLTILGQGTYNPEVDVATSGYLLETKYKKLVFDMGRGVLNNIYKNGYDYTEIDYVLITHMHPDHCNDLLSYIHLLHKPPEEARKRNQPVILFGPMGSKKKIQYLMRACNLDIDEKKLQIREKGEDLDIKIADGMVLSVFETTHCKSLNSISFRVEEEGRVFAYSGDTTDTSGLRRAVNKSDLAVMEATLPDDKPNYNHLSGYQAGIIANEGKVKRLVLTHIKKYNKNAFSEAKKNFHGEVIIAKDLMEVEV